MLFDGIVGVIGRGVASLLRPRRPAVIVAPADDRPTVAAPSAVIERRAKAYAQLATARGLALPLEARVDAHGVHFRGVIADAKRCSPRGSSQATRRHAPSCRFGLRWWESRRRCC